MGGREHINLTEDYIWEQNKQVKQGKLRPLQSSKNTQRAISPFRELTPICFFLGFLFFYIILSFVIPFVLESGI